MEATRQIKIVFCSPLLVMGVSCIVVLSLLQWFWLQGPLERDQSIYFVIAHELLQGRSLYQDLWDHKPPGIHLAYALSQLFAGYSMVAVGLLSVVVSAGTLLGLVTLGARIGFSRRAHLAVVFFWLIFCFSPNLEATQPNTESLINLCWVWALVVVQARQFPSLQIAFFAALATIFKPISLVLFLPIIFLSPLKLHPTILWSIQVAGALVASVFVLWGMGYWYFDSVGAGTDAYDALIEYNRYYAGDVLDNLAQLVQVRRLFPLAIISLLPFMIGLPIIALTVAQRIGRAQLLSIGCLSVAAYICIAFPGNFYLHYYQYMLIPLALLLGFVATSIEGQFGTTLLKIFFLLALIGEIPVAIFPGYFHRAPTYPNSRNVQARELALELAKTMQPGEWIYEWGAQPALYFELGISPRHGVLHVSALTAGPLAATLSQKTLSVLQRDPPALIIISRDFFGDKLLDHPVIAWILARYREVERDGDSPYLLLRRMS